MKSTILALAVLATLGACAKKEPASVSPKLSLSSATRQISALGEFDKNCAGLTEVGAGIINNAEPLTPEQEANRQAARKKHGCDATEAVIGISREQPRPTVDSSAASIAD